MKKPAKWAFDRTKVDPKWDWFWDSAVSVIPFWDIEVDNFNTTGNKVQNPIDLVDGRRWNAQADPTWPNDYPVINLKQGAAHSIVYHAGMYYSSPRAGGDAAYFPAADKATCLFVREKQDTIKRQSSPFGVSTDISEYRFSAHVPWTDGVVYFDYGGFSGSKRISAAGLPTSGIQAWAFTGGPNGLAFYLDGVKRASNTTPASRTLSSFNLGIGQGSTPKSDWEGFYFMAYLYHELTDAQARMWANDPYGPIREALPRRTLIAPTTQSINGARLYGRWAGDKGRGPNQRFDEF